MHGCNTCPRIRTRLTHLGCFGLPKGHSLMLNYPIRRGIRAWGSAEGLGSIMSSDGRAAVAAFCKAPTRAAILGTTALTLVSFASTGALAQQGGVCADSFNARAGN